MKLSQFKFKLPPELIAEYPAEHRDECRMLVLHRKTGEIEHREFKDFLEYFDDQDVFVFNDTKVFPARLYGSKEKTGARIEVFLLRELNREQRFWDVLVDPARKIRIGNKLYFGEDNSIVAEVIDNTTSRGRTLRFLYDGEPEDLERFQCIFARHEGAVTAPTAGMHFSKSMLKRMEIKGIESAFITLHCGLGGFNQTDVEDLTKHKMTSEEMHVNAECCEIVNRAKEAGHKICAVGTTVQRALETCVSTEGRIKEYEGWTSKFIFPPHDFSVADAMFSNFQMPLSTLLMLTAAFGGYEQVMHAYEVAIEEKYRFGVFGDVMLIVD